MAFTARTSFRSLLAVPAYAVMETDREFQVVPNLGQVGNQVGRIDDGARAVGVDAGLPPGYQPLFDVDAEGLAAHLQEP